MHISKNKEKMGKTRKFGLNRRTYSNLFLVLVVMLMSISLVSAWEFDNVKNFDKDVGDYGKYTIKNSILGIPFLELDKVIEIELKDNTDVCVGYECYANKEITLYEDGTLINDIRFLNVNKNYYQEINYDLYIVTEKKIEKIVDDYETQCNKTYVKSVYSEKNKNMTGDYYEEVCGRFKVGSHSEYEDELIKYKLDEEVKAGTYNIRLKGNLPDLSTTIDWQIKSNGYWLDEWAEWTSGLNVNLLAYWDMENDTVTNVPNLANSNLFNLTIVGPQLQVKDGIIGNSLGGVTLKGDSDYAYMPNKILSNLTANFTHNLWFNHSGGQVDGTKVAPLMGAKGGFNLGISETVLYFQKVGTGAISPSYAHNYDNLWHMYTGVIYSNGSISMFFDGVNVANMTTVPQTFLVSEGDDGYFSLFAPIYAFLSTRTIDLWLDEVGVWNRSLTFDEIAQLYNGGVGMTYTDIFNNLAIVLNSPVNNTNFSTSDITFNCTATDETALVNITLIIDGVDNYTVDDTGLTYQLNKTEILSDGTHNWTCRADDGTAVGNPITATELFLDIDATLPLITEINNLTNVIAFTLPTVSTWYYNVTDFNLDKCYYNTSDNSTLFFLTACNETLMTNWETEGSKIVYMFANDTFGNEVMNTSYINVSHISTNYSHTPDATAELGDVYFELYVNKTNIETTTAYLYFNNTIYNPTGTTNATNSRYFNYTFDVPDGWGNSSGKEYDYYWNYTISGIVNNQSTATDNFTIYSIDIDDCSTYGYPILNLTLKDEENNSIVNATGSTIEIDLEISKGTVSWIYNHTWSGKNNVSICVPNGVLNNSNYTIDFTIGYQSTDRVWEFYYLDNGVLSNDASSFDSLTLDEINLMDLLTADSTSFLFNYFDEDGLPVEDAIVHVFRKYIGEGTFREVERARQDQNGDTTVHLVEEDVIYQFIISEDGTTIYTSSTYTALCQAVPCTIQLEAGGDVPEFDSDDTWDLVDGGSYEITHSSITRDVNLSYVLDTTGTFNLTIFEYDEDGEYIPIATDTDTGTSGIITLNIPIAYGNKTYFASVWNDDEFVKSEWIYLQQDAGLVFGNSLALFLGFLIILTLGLMAITEGGAVIIWVIIGMLLTSILGLVDYHTQFGVSILIYFICAGGIILFKLTRRDK